MLTNEDLDKLREVYAEAETQAQIIASEMRRYEAIWEKTYDFSFDFESAEICYQFYVSEEGEFYRYLPIEWLTYDEETIKAKVDEKIKKLEEAKAAKENLEKALKEQRRKELDRFEYMRLKHIHGDDCENDHSYVLSVLNELERCMRKNPVWCGEIYCSANYNFRYHTPRPNISKFEFSLGGVNGTVEVKDGVPTIKRACYFDLENSGTQRYFDFSENLSIYSPLNIKQEL